MRRKAQTEEICVSRKPTRFIYTIEVKPMQWKQQVVLPPEIPMIFVTPANIRAFLGEMIRTPQMNKNLNRPGGPQPLRRTAARSFSLYTKQQRFEEVEGRCESCGELIGDGKDWRKAVFHHVRLVSDAAVTDKEARAPANCMVMHRDCHDDPLNFYKLHGFSPDNLKKKKEADTGLTSLVTNHSSAHMSLPMPQRSI